MDVLTLPIARSPLSKNNITPRNRNAIPKPASPTPISAMESTGTNILTDIYHSIMERGERGGFEIDRERCRREAADLTVHKKKGYPEKVLYQLNWTIDSILG